jgi:Survival protein SurE
MTPVHAGRFVTYKQFSVTTCVHGSNVLFKRGQISQARSWTVAGASSHTMPLNILISNDDGVCAPGIIALASALAASSLDLDIYVCAPATEQSARSQALTLARARVVEELAPPPGCKRSFACYGTPADSVATALTSTLFGVRRRRRPCPLVGTMAPAHQSESWNRHTAYVGSR